MFDRSPVSEAQVLADLQWVVTGPSLVTGTEVVGPGTFDPTTVDADHLARFVAHRSSHRVGRYFETLLLYWLEHIRQVELIGHAVQVRDGRRTIGELDYVYRDERGRVTHCEAAVKFFLHHPNDVGSHYPGPNATDSFEKKVAKLFDRQLAISASHPLDGYPAIEQREAFVRGCIFRHPDVPWPRTRPARLAVNHLRGWWMRSSSLERLADGASAAHVMAKPNWFAPAVDAAGHSIGDVVTALHEHFAGPAHPVMISRRDRHGAEIDRWFVVGPEWGPVS